MGTPAPFILDRSIQNVYLKKGWKIKDINDGKKPYPTMQELYDQFKEETEKTKYDSELKGNLQSVLEMRIGSLLRREMKEIFNVENSIIRPEDWLEMPVIIELESLGEGPANFTTLMLCTLIRETLKANPNKDKEKPLRHVIFIEEAHNLIGPTAQVQPGTDSDPKIAATAFIVKMLAEVRALREGIVIADQLPTAMAPEVIKNTNIKLVHRLTSGDDRELIGNTMSATPMQVDAMATLTQGGAFMNYEGLLRPFQLQVHYTKEHDIPAPSNYELYDIMEKIGTYHKLKIGMIEREGVGIINSIEHLYLGLDAFYHHLETYQYEEPGLENKIKQMNIIVEEYRKELIKIQDQYLEYLTKTENNENFENQKKSISEQIQIASAQFMNIVEKNKKLVAIKIDQMRKEGIEI